MPVPPAAYCMSSQPQFSSYSPQIFHCPQFHNVDNNLHNGISIHDSLNHQHSPCLCNNINIDLQVLDTNKYSLNNNEKFQDYDFVSHANINLSTPPTQWN